jgi:hypothetical protein
MSDERERLLSFLMGPPSPWIMMLLKSIYRPMSGRYA